MNGITISPSIRVRKTPFWDRVVQSGVKSCSIYNRMLLPVLFDSYDSDYFHLKEHVQLWDVSCERQVEVQGPDATKLIKYLTPRDIEALKPRESLYLPVVDQFGGMLNDPVLLKLSEERYWLSLADSDFLLWVLAIAATKNLQVKVFEPDVSPLAIQGPKANQLIPKIFGEHLKSLKFFQFTTINFNGKSFIIARSGYSMQGGFEIYVEGSENGVPIWDTIIEAGREFNIRAGSPNTPERIEGGLLSYGSDVTREDTPFECGLGKYCDVSKTPNCLGHHALKEKLKLGWIREIRYLKIVGENVPFCHTPWPVIANGKQVGKVTSAAWSPGFKTNVAITMIEKEFGKNGTNVEVIAPDQSRKATVYEKPFTKGRKQ